jgi:hypothetical protein
MVTKQFIVLSAVVAGLLSACGGGGGGGAGGADATSAPAAAKNPSPPKATTWSSVKIGGGGYVPGLIFHPTTPNLLYARTDIGGAYRWNQATSSWVPITDGFSGAEGGFMGGESIALDPNDDQRVYMSTGQYAWAGNGRLYISTDRGDHWQKVGLPFPVGSNQGGRAIGERMMVDPNLPSTLFYGSRTMGLWKSADRGQTWSQVQSLATATMTDAQIAASDGSAKGVELVVFDTSGKGSGTATSTIYVAIAPDYTAAAGLTSNLYKSTDAGATWTPVTTPVSGFHIPHMVRAADGMFYVAFTQGSGPGAGGPGRLYKFDGSNWTLLKSVDPDQWTSFGMGGLSVHGSGASTRIALGITNSWGNWEGQPVVALSDDAGNTWREIASMTPHTPDGGFSGWTDDVEIDPNNRDHILHVSGGGVWSTNDASSAKPSWVFLVNGIEETANVGLVAAPPGAAYRLINSSMDVGLLVHTDLSQPPTLGPTNPNFGSGHAADTAWSDPSYIVGIGSTTWGSTVAGVYSPDSGKTWSAFATNHPNALAEQSGESSIAVTQRNKVVWSVANSVPYYTTDGGATWQATNLPALDRLTVNRGYRVVADRKNPNKVYAYDSGGAWWGTDPKFYTSTDGGHTFTRSTHATLASLHKNNFQTTWLAVNPYAEGDVWIADGINLYHSVDSGATWKQLTAMQAVWGNNPTWMTPEIFGATSVALGKPAAGAKYSAAVYVVGVMNGVWGLYRSDDGGNTWTRMNDDQHQFGGMGNLAADHSVYGRVYLSGTGRGLLYSN